MNNILIMKLKIFRSLIFIFIMTSCSINNEDAIPQASRSEWHLRNVSGGLAGVNNDFDFNQVIWMFNEPLSSLTVLNNNTNAIEDGLDSGTYAYSILDDVNNTFLIIDDHEFGGLTISNNILTIDQNLISTGSGADGFIYTFQIVETIE